jgi:hypothetical protein
MSAATAAAAAKRNDIEVSSLGFLELELGSRGRVRGRRQPT